MLPCKSEVASDIQKFFKRDRASVISLGYSAASRRSSLFSSDSLQNWASHGIE